jgi:putative heme-binding domain-containing protein
VKRTATSSLLCGLTLLFLLGLRTAAQSTDHPGQYDRADIQAGARLYAAQCVGCHGAAGDQVVGIDLRRGTFKTVQSDEDLVRLLTRGKPDVGMPSFATFQPAEMTGIVAYIRAGFDAGGTAVKIGDATRGRLIFQGKGSCATCHRVNGVGPRMAPDLSDVGAARSAASLQRLLLDPTANLLPASRSVRAVTRDGQTIRGRRLNEDTFTIQLIDDQERLVSLVKSELRTLELSSSSAMQSYANTLSGDELADLVAYLVSLKGLP